MKQSNFLSAPPPGQLSVEINIMYVSVYEQSMRNLIFGAKLSHHPFSTCPRSNLSSDNPIASDPNAQPMRYCLSRYWVG